MGVRAAEELGVEQAAGLMSATYCTWPVTFSGPSGRGIESPTPLTSRVVFISRHGYALLPGGRGAGGLGDGRHHLGVAGAPAEVARDTVADLLLGGARVLLEQGGRRHSTPGMQKPHCGTPCRTNASWSGCSAPVAARPSMVRTARPRTCMASIRQLATGLPSRCTVQAPQSPVPQPSLGPVRPSSSRSASSSVVVGLDEHLDRLVVDRALQESVSPRVGSSRDQCARPRQGGGQGAAGQDADQMTAELGRAALIGDRVARRRRPAPPPARSARGSRPGLPAPPRPGRPNRRRRHGGERDPRLDAHAVRERQLRGHATTAMSSSRRGVWRR